MLALIVWMEEQAETWLDHLSPCLYWHLAPGERQPGKRSCNHFANTNTDHILATVHAKTYLWWWWYLVIIMRPRTQSFVPECVFRHLLRSLLTIKQVLTSILGINQPVSWTWGLNLGHPYERWGCYWSHHACVVLVLLTHSPAKYINENDYLVFVVFF